MKKEIFREIEIPEGIGIRLEKNILIIKGPEGENKREISTRNLVFEIKDNKIKIGNKKSTKKDKKRIQTLTAHIKNMIKGVQNKFVYELKTVFSHFPITVEVKGNEISVKNFLGEKVARKCHFPKGAEIKMDKEKITVSSTDKELAGQTAANLERVTRIRNRDRRVFQDGIFITTKAGREM